MMFGGFEIGESAPQELEAIEKMQNTTDIMKISDFSNDDVFLSLCIG